MCVYVPTHVWEPAEARKWQWIPWSWNYRRLIAAQHRRWEQNSGIFEEQQALNYGAICPVQACKLCDICKLMRMEVQKRRIWFQHPAVLFHLGFSRSDLLSSTSPPQASLHITMCASWGLDLMSFHFKFTSPRYLTDLKWRGMQLSTFHKAMNCAKISGVRSWRQKQQEEGTWTISEVRTGPWAGVTDGFLGHQRP